jgi:RimJ/RimL family protein N-acetyltransferase
MTRLETDRLLLRPVELRDAPAITRWIGDYDVAKNLATAPHPYGEDDARAFIARVTDGLAKREGWCFAIVRKEDFQFIGCCGVRLKDGRYELGYWLGKPFWNRGYCTEAVRQLLGFAFRDLGAESVQAGWLHDNPSSGHVLEKLGFLPGGAEARTSLARGCEVHCHLSTLTREDFQRKRAPVTAGAVEAR